MVCTLRWMILFCLSVVALVISGALGLLDELYRVDNTFISFGILGLYVLMTLFVGWMTWAAPSSVIARYRPACNSAQEVMTGLGMLGTVIGFLQMLSGGFGGLDIGNVQSVQAVLGRISSGVGVALTTTLVGLVCSLALHAQLVNLDLAGQE